MPNLEGRVRFAAFLNLSLTVLEIVGGLLKNSLAILPTHYMTSATASHYSHHGSSNEEHADHLTPTEHSDTKDSLFSVLFSASILIGGSIVIIFQAIPRLLNPETVNATGMVGLVVICIIFNGAGFFMLKKGESLNEKCSLGIL